MYLYNTWEETGDESVECRALRKFLRQIELHKTGASCKEISELETITRLSQSE